MEGETKRKVRIVAKGYTEVWGEDFWHTYSPTLGCNTLFSSLTYAASCNLEIHHLNAVSAYLNSDLHEEIYLRPPDGIPLKPGTVWLLKKALYGQMQAGLEWFKTLWNHIKSIGYSQSGYNPCLYVKDSNHFVVVYVDNLLLFSTIVRITNEKEELTGHYEMCDLGEARWCQSPSRDGARR